MGTTQHETCALVRCCQVLLCPVRRCEQDIFVVQQRVQTAGGGFFISEGSGTEAKAVESKFSCVHSLASTGDSDSAPVCIVVFTKMTVHTENNIHILQMGYT